jgi:glycosyltransferase involved in cell wall biosynthesis
MERTVVVIPAFNAAATLPELIRRIEPFVPRTHILVVDDGSHDGTAVTAAAEGVRVLKHHRNFGKGRALRTGFEYVLRSTDDEFVVTMDADLQHRPEELPSFFMMLRRHQFDLLVGYRPRWGTSMPLPRKLSNAITSFLVSARTGVPISDSQCGYRLISRRAVESVELTADGYEAETEFLIKAASKGFRIGFVPISTVYDTERSYMTHARTTFRFLQTLLREY